MKKGPEQAPDEPSAEETAAEVARIKEQAQGFGNGIKGLEGIKGSETPAAEPISALRELRGLREAVQAEEKREKKTKLHSVLKNLSQDELIKRTISVAMKDPETVGQVSKKLTEQTKRIPRKIAEQPLTQSQPLAQPPAPKTERAQPPKKSVPTLSKYAADSGEDTLTMTRHIARVRRGKSVVSPPPTLVPAVSVPTPIPSAVPKEKITIPAFERPVALVAPLAESTPPPLISPEGAPKAPEGANRLDNPAFAQWVSEIEGIKAGNPADVEKFFKAFEIKENVKSEVLRVWRERIAKESGIQLAEADLALIASQLENLARREPEKFVVLYGETVKRFTEMPAEIARLEAQLGRVNTRTIAERRPGLMAEEKKLELAKASNRFLTGFGGGWGRLTGVMAWASGSETLKAQAEARKDIQKEGKYRTIFGGVSAGGFSAEFLRAKGGAVGVRLAEIGKEYTDSIGKNHTDRAQVEIALARAKKELQGARAEVFADIGVKREMSEFLSAKVAETVKQITTHGQITSLEDWMAADEWVRELSARVGDADKLADYLRGFSQSEVQTKIAVGIRETLQATIGEIVAKQLEHPENPGRATELFLALDGALGALLTKKQMGVIKGDNVIQEVAASLTDEEKKITNAGEKNSALKATYIQSIRVRLWAKYRSPVAAPVETPPTAEGLVKELEEAGLVPPEKI